MFENQGYRGVLGLPFGVQMVVPAGLEPARHFYFQVHRRGTCTPGFTERYGTIHGPVTCYPYSFESRHGANFTGLYSVYQISCYRMRNFTCRPLYLPSYPTNAPFGIWHLLRTAQSGLEAALPIAFDGWVSIPFSSTGREIQIGYNLQKRFFGGRSSFAPCFERQMSSSTNVYGLKVNSKLITLFC